MARIDIKMPEDFLMKVSRLSDKTDSIIPTVLEVGGKVVLDKVKDNLRSVIGKETKYPSKATGELLSSLGLTSAKQDRDGNYNIKVGFAEPRSGSGSNARIANIIEYGKHGQPAKPFLKPTKSASRKACIEAMSTRFEEEIKKL